MDLLHEPHHDGSPDYLEPGRPELGATVAVRLRVPHAAAADAVSLRTTPDAEPRFAAATVAADTADATWWVAELPVVNPVTRYRFLLEGGVGGRRWHNSAGTWSVDVADAGDFVLTTHERPPDWLAATVGYQIFPDRFASSGARRDAPAWAIPTAWDEPPATTADERGRQYYGGDLAGIEARLDHLADLGVNLLYLTPVFPARSTHRYDATTFEHVDPLLGGDGAYAALTAAAHRRGMRIIGDLTLNHTGSHHEWFLAAQADAASPEAGFYVFHHHPADYLSWSGVPSLPKLDHRSRELRRRLIDGDGAVARRWLDEPYRLDGWRIDCANVTGRFADVDRNAEVAAAMRTAMSASAPHTWLVAEHCYDATTDLEGGGWHGVMAYHWFSRPLWSWLGADPLPALMGTNPVPRFSGREMVEAMRGLVAGVSWPAITASMTMLDSHDSARFRTVVGDRTLHLVGMAMLFAFPGVPTIFAGSEVGVTGADMDTCRVPFPWDESQWDRAFLDDVRTLVRLRTASAALQRGAMRWVHAGHDSVTFLRESGDERVLVHLARAAHDPVRLDAAALGWSAGATCCFGDHLPVLRGGVIELPGHAAGAWIWALDPGLVSGTA